MQEEESEEEDDLGRKRRRGKGGVSYAEDASDADFLRLMERSDSDGEAPARKPAVKRKRLRKVRQVRQ